jgi:predicted secreted protein
LPSRVLKSIKHWLHPVPSDARGRRFVAVIECLLNQNARDAGAANAPALDQRLVQICHDHNVGILQMPCPEIHALGFSRQRGPGQSIRDALNEKPSAERCAALAHDVGQRIEIYLNEGYQLVAVLGGNQDSPGCAVHDEGMQLSARSGLFMQQLQQELLRRGHAPRFLAVRDCDPELRWRDLLSLERLLCDK